MVIRTPAASNNTHFYIDQPADAGANSDYTRCFNTESEANNQMMVYQCTLPAGILVASSQHLLIPTIMILYKLTIPCVFTLRLLTGVLIASRRPFLHKSFTVQWSGTLDESYHTWFPLGEYPSKYLHNYYHVLLLPYFLLDIHTTLNSSTADSIHYLPHRFNCHIPSRSVIFLQRILQWINLR